MFDYKKKTNAITIGYRIHEMYWHQGIAFNAIELMVRYLFKRGIDSIYAYVMPDNIYSSRALLRNGFAKEVYMVQEKNWGGLEVVDLEVYVLKKSENMNGGARLI